MPKPSFHDEGLRSVSELKGVGPTLTQKLGSRGIHCIQDLWLQLPVSFEDRTQIVSLDSLQIGQTAQIEVRVVAVERGFRFRPMLKVIVEDDSLRQVCLRFFHYSSQQANQFIVGRLLRCYGQIRLGANHFEIVHPSYRFITEDQVGLCSDRLDPVYSNFDGVGALTLAKLVQQSLKYLPSDESFELIPEPQRNRLDLMALSSALRLLHQPVPGMLISDVVNGKHPAIKRLVFEELMAHHLSLRQKRLAIKAKVAQKIAKSTKVMSTFIQSLPYQLTEAQKRVWLEIQQDMSLASPMLRLVQGDVGCGKTVITALAALAVIAKGGQAALMAPTELLAEQHARTFQAWLEPLGIEVIYLISKQSAALRKKNLQRIADGAAMVIGTHALMQEHVQYKNLLLVMVDEQHRFGVHQRLSLRDKGEAGEFTPHQLILTATPIPRTLAMAAYADLDISVIDELPPGRTPVQTVAIANSRRDEIIERIEGLCQQGNQVYWVCTLIDESEEIQAQSAQAAFELISSLLPSCSIALLHSKVPQAQKAGIMNAFKANQIQILVATTVIEVGVDVPNASVMVIENAERLGLAQLHQLRGRVGRGSVSSHCILLYRSPLSALAKERIDVMRQTDSGFIIAEKDLQLRGPGEILGTKQTGDLGYRIADLSRDANLLPDVIELANQLLVEHSDNAQQIVNRWIGSAVRFVNA